MLDKKVADWVNLILGIWVLVSPWVLAFSASTGATWSAVVLGVLVIAASAWALSQSELMLVEWANLVLGILLFIAPWVIGYFGSALPAWNSWIFGVLVFLVAAYTFIPSTHTHGQPLAH